MVYGDTKIQVQHMRCWQVQHMRQRCIWQLPVAEMFSSSESSAFVDEPGTYDQDSGASGASCNDSDASSSLNIFGSSVARW